MIINYNSLKSDKGRGQRELMQILSDLFGAPEVITRHAESIMLGVSHVPEAVVEDGEIRYIELGEIKREFSDTSSINADVARIVKTSSDKLFLYHPSRQKLLRGN